MSTLGAPKQRHVPQRTCIVCGKKAAKGEFIRMVAGAGNSIEVDLTGKLPGRGAYVCKDMHEAPGQIKKSRIEYALRTKMEDDDWARLGTVMR